MVARRMQLAPFVRSILAQVWSSQVKGLPSVQISCIVQIRSASSRHPGTRLGGAIGHLGLVPARADTERQAPAEQPVQARDVLVSVIGSTR